MLLFCAPHTRYIWYVAAPPRACRTRDDAVAEEGLDIGDVDLILCFDAQQSSTRLVQRMGRTGRKRDGRVVLFVTEGREYGTFQGTTFVKA